MNRCVWFMCISEVMQCQAETADEDDVPTANAAAMPLRASKAVRALAYVAIFMPTKPETMEETAPMRKAIVEKTPLYRAGALLTPVCSSMCHLVEKPSWELSSTKMMTEKMACKEELIVDCLR